MDDPAFVAAPDWLAPGDDLNELVAGLWPSGSRRGDRGELLIQNRSVTDLVRQHGSPLYLIDKEDFCARAREFSEAFPGWDVYYAGKAFLSRRIARWVEAQGLGLDVCSGNELAVALLAGFPPERIELHGNNKSVEELAQAIDAGVGRIIVDSFAEIDRVEAMAKDRGTEVVVLVRVTTGVSAHTHDYIATAHEDQKFGFSIQSGQAMKALLACAQRPHIELKGLHSHIGSQIFDTEGFRLAARRLMELASDYQNTTGEQLTELNLGGGFGIQYTAADQPLPPETLAAQLIDIIEQARSQYGLGAFRLAIEPGRAICGPAGIALYTVGTIKEVEVSPGILRTYVSVDGGMSDNIRTALYNADYTAVVANRSSEAQPMLSRVVGKHCESGDQLVRDVYLPGDLQVGDILAVPGSGAYARSLASNYNHALRPAVLSVDGNGVEVIMRRETLEDLLALDIDPPASVLNP